MLDISSHWEFEYTKDDAAAWQAYFPRVRPMLELCRRLFTDVGDPVDRIAHAFGNTWGKQVRRARHPQYDQPLFAGLIRSGGPRLHFDWAPFDLPGLEAVMQAGANVYLANFQQGGHLKVYRTYGMTKGHTKASGVLPIGNYDLPHALVEGVESVTIPCGVGDLVLAPNRFLHEVTAGAACM